MRDYCRNLLKLSGDTKEIKRFKKQGKDVYIYDEEDKDETALSLQKFLPMPAALDDNPKPDVKMSAHLKDKYGYDNWFEWCLNNWGTATDIIADDPIDNAFDFETEVAPPIQAIVAISKRFPGIMFLLNYLNFVYEDEGLANFGNLAIQNGKIKSREYRKKARCVFCPDCNRVIGPEPESPKKRR